MFANLIGDAWYEFQGHLPVLLLNLLHLAERKADVLVERCLREDRQDNKGDHQQLQGSVQL